MDFFLGFKGFCSGFSFSLTIGKFSAYANNLFLGIFSKLVFLILIDLVFIDLPMLIAHSVVLEFFFEASFPNSDRYSHFYRSIFLFLHCK